MIVEMKSKKWRNADREEMKQTWIWNIFCDIDFSFTFLDFSFGGTVFCLIYI